MTDPLRLLVLGKDQTLFEGGSDVPSDTRGRHIRYAEVMRSILPEESEIRIVTYSTTKSRYRFDDAAPGLKIFGTCSRHRAAYVADAALIVRQMLKSGWRPTAITTQTPWEEGLYGALLARWLGVRFLPQLHFDLFSPDWRAERFMNRWRFQLGKRILRSGTRVRTVSKPLRDKLIDSGVEAARIDVIPVGVRFEQSVLTVDAAKAALHPELVGHPVVLFVGRLVASKNLRLWLDVASEVLAEMPDVRFVIVGSGDKEVQLRRIVAERNQTAAILLLGARGHAQLPDIYRAADVFLLTSDHEGFGRVVLEAAFAGVPSVATRCSGPEDIIDDGISGILVDKHDRSGLAAGVLKLLRDESTRGRLGGAARASADSRFGVDALAKMLVAHWSRG